MPANLTHGYRKAERAYRQAATAEEELTCLRAMLRELPKHKGTDRLQGELKQKISQAVKDLEKRRDASQKSSSFRLPRQGAGRAVLLGGPNAGKSRLMAGLTHSQASVADYPFSTRRPEVAMMACSDTFVQLVDTPPIARDFCETFMQGLIRGADVAILVADLGSDTGLEDCLAVVDHLDTTKTRLGVHNRFDALDIGRSYTRTILAATKADLPGFSMRLGELRARLAVDFPCFSVSAESGEGLEDLGRGIYQALDVVRVYTKSPREKQADRSRPYTIPRGQPLMDVAEQIHGDFAKRLRFARVWGKGVHDGTPVGADYVPNDGDIVEFHL